MTRRVLSILLLLLAARGSGTAHAQTTPPNDPAAAQALFYRARALMQQGKYAEACPKLEESMRLDSGIGTQFNLADCNEHIGKLATAWAGFLDVAAASKTANQTEREKVARGRAQALESRIPKLVIDASGAAGGLEVARDGIAVGPSAWGTELPVDTGTHRITAIAPGKQKWETAVEAAEGRVAYVAVPRDLPAATVATVTIAPSTPPPVTSGTSDASITTTTTAEFPPPVVDRGTSPQLAIGWVIAGAGVIGVGVGAGFGLSSLSKRDDSRGHCNGDLCDAEGVRLRDDAIRNGNIATISMIAGGAAIAGGLILVLTAPSGSAPQERTGKLRAVPNVAKGGGGLMLQGSFQ